MSDRHVLRVLFIAFLGFFSLLSALVYGFDTACQWLFVAPLAFLATAASIDAGIRLYSRIAPCKRREWELLRALILSLALIPLPVGVLLWLITLVFGPLGGVVSFAEAWRLSTSFLVAYWLFYACTGKGDIRFLTLSDWIKTGRKAFLPGSEEAGGG